MRFSKIEKQYQEKKIIIAGFDEAGRGPMAGPVVAAGVVLPKDFKVSILNDSKKLNPKAREKAYQFLKAEVHIGVGMCSVEEIDKFNIFNASLRAMGKAYQDLRKKIDLALIDGPVISPHIRVSQQGIVKGDSKIACIAAASIVAKVIRDSIMEDLAKKYPQYKFEQHKGYPTELHRKLIKKHGRCKHHRKSFYFSEEREQLPLF